MNSKWDRERLEKVKNIYSSGVSAREVANQLGVSMSAVYHAMRRYNIQRRKSSETNTIQFYKSPVTFSTKTNLNLKENTLKVAGLMLYWSEGGKRNKGIIDFANCDEKMILTFLKFLRKIYGIREEKLRVYLYCFTNQNPEMLIDYWSKLTKIPKFQFSKPYVKASNTCKVHGKMNHGLIHVRYADVKLFSLLMDDLQKAIVTL